MEEIRLRVGQPLTVQQKGQEQEVPYSAPVTENDLRLTLELASQASVHMVLDKLRQGFLTVPGGTVSVFAGPQRHGTGRLEPCDI